MVGTRIINTTTHNKLDHDTFQADDGTLPQALYLTSLQETVGPLHLGQLDNIISQREESPVRQPVMQEPTNKKPKLLERLDPSSKKLHREDGRSLLPKPSPDKTRDTKVSALAKHFEQLSREFEKERLRDRKARGAKVNPSRKPIVEVYNNVNEAVEETGPGVEDSAESYHL